MSVVDLNLARDEMDRVCHACAFDVGACCCVVECGALVCTGARPEIAVKEGGQ